MPMGLQLFKGDTVNKEHSFCLFRCFTHLKKEQDITFTDSSIERILDIKMLLPFEGIYWVVICISVKILEDVVPVLELCPVFQNQPNSFSYKGRIQDSVF